MTNHWLDLCVIVLTILLALVPLVVPVETIIKKNPQIGRIGFVLFGAVAVAVTFLAQQQANKQHENEQKESNTQHEKEQKESDKQHQNEQNALSILFGRSEENVQILKVAIKKSCPDLAQLADLVGSKLEERLSKRDQALIDREKIIVARLQEAWQRYDSRYRGIHAKRHEEIPEIKQQADREEQVSGQEYQHDEKLIIEDAKQLRKEILLRLGTQTEEDKKWEAFFVNPEDNVQPVGSTLYLYLEDLAKRLAVSKTLNH